MEKGCNSKLLLSLKDRDEFTLTFELVPGPGGRSRQHSRIVNLAKEIAADGRFQALSITENAGGHPALTPEALGREIHAMGSEVIIHFSCKDKNRNQMESLLFGWDRQHLCNLLVIAGDYPGKGYQGYPKPVFDLDTTQALHLLSALNSGSTIANPETPASNPQSTSFVKGVAVSPFKFLEAEVMMQYFALHRKVAAGADFVITQLGYDARKFHELLLYMQQNRLDVPVLGNVFIPNLTVAELMYRRSVPGCVIPETLYRQIRQEATADDKGKKARLLRAAKLLAILKGLGYAGAHIGGPGLCFADLDFVLTSAAALRDTWRDCVRDVSFWPEEAFWYFGKDSVSGLNTETPNVREGGKKRPLFGYAAACLIHDLVFDPKGLLYQPMKKVWLGLNKENRCGVFCRLEYILKVVFFGCQNCGDCTLAELAYLCPQSGCAKYLLNGPCGGSRDGWCEVYPGSKRCHFVKVYERLRSRGLEEGMKKGFVPPRDWALNNTSAWANYFAGRDHAGRIAGKG
jgi:methylenetetrahydrofolate reductase (NADPH)